MPRQANPYQGTYSPASVRMSAKEFKAGIKGIKIKTPNRKYSENAYKVALPKEHEPESR